MFPTHETQVKDYGDLVTLPEILKNQQSEKYVDLIDKMSYGFYSQASMNAALGNWNNAIIRLRSSYLKKVIKGEDIPSGLAKCIETSAQKQSELDALDKKELCFDVYYLENSSLLSGAKYHSNFRRILKEDSKFCRVVADSFSAAKKEIAKMHKFCLILDMRVDEDAELD